MFINAKFEKFRSCIFAKREKPKCSRDHSADSSKLNSTMFSVCLMLMFTQFIIENENNKRTLLIRIQDSAEIQMHFRFHPPIKSQMLYLVFEFKIDNFHVIVEFCENNTYKYAKLNAFEKTIVFFL